MILSFADRDTERFAAVERIAAFHAVRAAAVRKLALLNSAEPLGDLTQPPGNRLEALRGDRAGQHSIRINRQYRLCFVWDEAQGGAREVEIVDDHRG